MILDADARTAARWARDILQQNPLILDTETTGLQNTGEVCQMAVIDTSGAVKLNTLVRPSHPIPPGATLIHGITNAMVKDAPSWPMVAQLLEDLLRKQRTLIIYNAVFDLEILSNSDRSWRIVARQPGWWELDFHCAMTEYARFWGDWNDYRSSYRWQKLTVACKQQQIPDPVAPAHSALGDCLRTLALLNVMAQAANAESDLEEPR